MRVDEVVAIDHEGRRLLWVDIESPSKIELEALAEQYMLPFQAVKDCLEAEHFPKFERFGDLNFVILRSFDPDSPCDADSIQEVTRKIAVFETESLVISIHRREQNFLAAIKDTWRTKSRLGEDCKSHSIMLTILSGVIETYRGPMDVNRKLLEEFEVKVFKHSGDTFEDGYFLKRRANTFQQVIHMTLDILPSVFKAYSDEASQLQDVKENGERLQYLAKEFYENISNLVTLQLSLQSHRMTVGSFRTNEVMRILTIVSVCFMPLNLLAGIYGMNFEYMPELKWEYGFLYVLALMLSCVGLTLYFFKNKGYFEDQNSKL
jgi:magnesium transporter